jgi:hypothetical protein
VLLTDNFPPCTKHVGPVIVLNKQPKFRPDDVVIPFVKGSQGLYFLEEHFPEEPSAVAMVAQRMTKLTNAELVLFNCVIFVQF